MEGNLVPASEVIQKLQHTGQSHKFKFHGKGVEMAILVFTNILLTLVTLGVYNFWAKTKTRKYIRQHLEFSGDRFNYTGTGLELFLGFVPVILAGSGFVLFQIFLQKLFPAFSPFVSGAFSMAFSLAIPFFIYWSMAYKLSRTQWRNIRFGLTKKGASEFARSFILGYIFVIFTLGLYLPFWQENMARAMIANARFGTGEFRYTGSGKSIFWTYWSGVILSIFTLGLFFPWHMARTLRYRFENIQFQGAKAKLTVTGGEMLKLLLLGYLGVILTLGLAIPWIMHYTIAFFAERTEMQGLIDFTSIVQAPQGEGGPGSEMVADALDVSIGF